jgi:hypothetical protein
MIIDLYLDALKEAAQFFFDAQLSKRDRDAISSRLSLSAHRVNHAWTLAARRSISLQQLKKKLSGLTTS